jgi:predicted ATPase
VEEVIRSLIDQEIIYHDGERWRVKGSIETAAVPAGLRSLIRGRVDRLHAEVRQVLQSAAVIGRLVPLRLLGQINPAPITLEEALWELQERGLVYQEQVLPEKIYSFQHSLTQETIYDGMLRRERAALHLRVAETMEMLYAEGIERHYEMLAHHYERAGSDAKAIEYLYLSAEKAKRNSAYEAALTACERALARLGELPEGPERAAQELRLQTGLGPVLIAVRGFGAPEVAHVYRRARERCNQLGETPELFPVLCGLWLFHLTRADNATARELAEELTRLAWGHPDTALSMIAHISLGHTLFWQGEFVAAREQLQTGLELYDPMSHRSLMFLYGQDFGVAGRTQAAWNLWMLGNPDEAWRQCDEALRLAFDLRHPFTLTSAMYLPIALAFFARDVPAVRERTEELIRVATEQGYPLWVAMGTLYRGWVVSREGCGEAGISLMQRSIDALAATGFDLGLTCSMMELGDACLHIGQTEAGLAAVEKGLAAAEATGERYCEAELHRLKGELLLALSPEQGAEAEGCFRRALEVARGQQARSWELRAATSLGRLWQRHDKRDAARALLAPVYAGFTEGFDRADLQDARALLDGLA